MNTTQNNEELVSYFGLAALPKKALSNVVAEVTRHLSESIATRAIPLLTPNERVTFEKMLAENASNDEVRSFLKHTIPDLGQIATEEAVLLREILNRSLPQTSRAKKLKAA